MSSILENGTTADIVKANLSQIADFSGEDLGYVLTSDQFNKAVEDMKLEVYNLDAINKYRSDIQKAADSGALKSDDLEKAKKNLAKLRKVTKVDKNGKKTTVWVKTGEEPKHKDYKSHTSNDLEEIKSTIKRQESLLANPKSPAGAKKRAEAILATEKAKLAKIEDGVRKQHEKIYPSDAIKEQHKKIYPDAAKKEKIELPKKGAKKDQFGKLAKISDKNNDSTVRQTDKEIKRIDKENGKGEKQEPMKPLSDEQRQRVKDEIAKNKPKKIDEGGWDVDPKNKLSEPEQDYSQRTAKKSGRFKPGSRIIITSGPKDVKGKVGIIGEVRHGLHKKAAKTYTIDYDRDPNTGYSKSVMLSASQIKHVSEEDWNSKGKGAKSSEPETKKESTTPVKTTTGDRSNTKWNMPSGDRSEYPKQKEVQETLTKIGRGENSYLWNKEPKDWDKYDLATFKKYKSGDIKKAIEMEEGNMLDVLEKAGGKKDLSRLKKVTKTDKNGKKSVVWVKATEDPKKEKKTRQEQPEAAKKSGKKEEPKTERSADHEALIIKKKELAEKVKKHLESEKDPDRRAELTTHATRLENEHKELSGEGKKESEESKKHVEAIADTFRELQEDGNEDAFYEVLSKHYEPEDDGESEYKMFSNIEKLGAEKLEKISKELEEKRVDLREERGDMPEDKENTAKVRKEEGEKKSDNKEKEVDAIPDMSSMKMDEKDILRLYDDNFLNRLKKQSDPKNWDKKEVSYILKELGGNSIDELEVVNPMHRGMESLLYKLRTTSDWDPKEMDDASYQKYELDNKNYVVRDVYGSTALDQQIIRIKPNKKVSKKAEEKRLKEVQKSAKKDVESKKDAALKLSDEANFQPGGGRGAYKHELAQKSLEKLAKEAYDSGDYANAQYYEKQADKHAYRVEKDRDMGVRNTKDNQNELTDSEYNSMSTDKMSLYDFETAFDQTYGDTEKLAHIDDLKELKKKFDITDPTGDGGSMLGDDDESINKLAENLTKNGWDIEGFKKGNQSKDDKKDIKKALDTLLLA